MISYILFRIKCFLFGFKIPISYFNYIDTSYKMECPSHWIIYVDPFRGKRYKKSFYNDGFITNKEFEVIRFFKLNQFEKFKKYHCLNLINKIAESKDT